MATTPSVTVSLPTLSSTTISPMSVLPAKSSVMETRSLPPPRLTSIRATELPLRPLIVAEVNPGAYVRFPPAGVEPAAKDAPFKSITSTSAAV